jgi:hypothetical protein
VCERLRAGAPDRLQLGGAELPDADIGRERGPPSSEGVATAIVSAAKGAVKRGKALLGRTEQALEDPAPLSTFVLVLVGMLTLAAASLGALLLVEL